MAFFHDVFGMDVPPLPESGQRPFNRANPQLFAMFDIPGARERHQPARVPGARVSVEPMEIQDVDHRTLPLRVQDPGRQPLSCWTLRPRWRAWHRHMSRSSRQAGSPSVSPTAHARC